MKRNEIRGKRVNQAPTHTQSDRTLVADPSIFNQKEVLQQRLQAEEYNPFGKAGSGAPNPRGQQTVQNSSLLAHSCTEEFIQHSNTLPMGIFRLTALRIFLQIIETAATYSMFRLPSNQLPTLPHTKPITIRKVHPNFLKAL